jgi:AcrR family transcriptional regulator
MGQRRAVRVRLAEVVRELPRRAHDLSRRTVRESQWWRLVEAVTEVVARMGYAGASVADVIAVAGVSRKTFYERFRDKEDCFLAAYDFLSDRSVEALVAVGQHHGAGAPRRRAQITAFVTSMNQDRLAGRVFMVDVLGAGPNALRRRERVNASFGEAVLGAGVDPLRRAAIVGGVNTVVAAALLDNRRDLLDLVEPLCAFVEAALDPIQRARSTPQRRRRGRRPARP